MATSTVTANCNVDSLSWYTNDALVINNGAVVTVNTDQTKGWQYVTINNGKLLIENNSTTTPINFRLCRGTNNATTITPVSGLSSLEVKGNWIEIGTGDGTAGQIMTVPYHHYVAAVWVETAPGSDQYKPWVNCLRKPSILGEEWMMDGFNGFGNGIRGRTFRQTPETNTYHQVVAANVTISTASRLITVPDTTGIQPGAHVVATAGLGTAHFVNRVIDGTTLELNAVGTLNTSATVTIWNTEACWFSQQIVFGDGINGNVVPAGCKVRVPNIMLISDHGLDVTSTASQAGLSIVTTGGCDVTLDTCLIPLWSGVFVSPKSLTIKHVGFSRLPDISKCSQLYIEDVLGGMAPILPYLTGGHLTGLEYQSPRAWTYIKGGVIKDFHFYCGTSALNAAAGDITAMLSMQYCEGVRMERIHVQASLIQQYRTFSLYFSNNNTIDDITLIGSSQPLYMYNSNGNTITNIVYGLWGFKESLVPSSAAGAWNMFSIDGAGNNFENGKTYTLKFRRIPSFLKDAPYHEMSRTYSAAAFYSANPYMVQEFACIATGPTTVVFYWDDRRNIVAPSPLYVIYRSTDPLVPVRDVSTQIWSTSTLSTTSATDSTVVTDTQYYYVLRKYFTVDLTSYEDTPVVPCKPCNENVPNNYVAYSTDFRNAAWIQNYVSFAAGADIMAPALTSTPMNTMASFRRVTVTSANARLLQTVTGLTIGTTYTASIWVRFSGKYTAASTPVQTTPMRLTFGNTVEFTAGQEWTRPSVTFTATSYAHNIDITFVESGNNVELGNCQVNVGNIAIADVYTAATALATTVLYPTELRTFASFEPSSQHPVIGLYMPSEVSGVGYQTWAGYIGDTVDFVPSMANLFMFSNSYNGFSFTYSGSSRNKISNITQSGKADRAGLISLSYSSSDNLIENYTCDTAASTYSTLGLQGALVYVTSDSNRNTLRNCNFGTFFESSSSVKWLKADNSVVGNTLEKIRLNRYANVVNIQMNGTVLKGVAGGKLIPDDGITYSSMGGSATGLPITFNSIYDTHFAELYQGETEGALRLMFTASTSGSPPYVLTGSAAFSNTGYLYFQKAGDSATYTWPHKIYGVSGFRNIAPMYFSNDLSVNNTANSGRELAQSLLVEYQLDTGSGWESWKKLTPTNLAGEVLSASAGFNLKIRFTARPFINYNSKTNNFVVGETVRHTVTGYTAKVDIDIDNGTTGMVILSDLSNTGDWGASAGYLVRDSDSKSRAGVSLVNSVVLGPSTNSYLRGFQIFTNIDQSVSYPSDLISLSITGIVTGSDVTFRQSGTETVLANFEDISGGAATYEYYTAGNSVDVDIYKPGYIPYTTIRNYMLTDKDSSIPVTQSQDPSYLD